MAGVGDECVSREVVSWAGVVDCPGVTRKEKKISVYSLYQPAYLPAPCIGVENEPIPVLGYLDAATQQNIFNLVCKRE